MTHEITISAGPGGWIFLTCSCQKGGHNGPDELASSPAPESLDELNRIAHEHIEASERGEGYGTKSAITSEDELIDLELPGMWERADLVGGETDST